MTCSRTSEFTKSDKVRIEVGYVHEAFLGSSTAFSSTSLLNEV